MRKIFALLLIIILSSLSFAQNTDKANETDKAKQADKANQLDDIFTMLYEQNQFDGSVVIADKGKIIFKKSYGYRDENSKKPNNSQTIFELASLSKQFTAMGVMLLKRDGKLDYDDKLSKYTRTGFLGRCNDL